MKIRNMTNSRGKKVVNQFIITREGRGAWGNFTTKEIFQSNDKVIAVRTVWPDETRIELDRNFWDRSATIDKYRTLFLGETKKETQKKIDSGEYSLITNLKE